MVMRVTAALTVLALMLALPGCQAASGETFQYTFNQPMTLSEEGTLGQTFQPATEVVAGVDVLMATFRGDLGAGNELQAVLRDGIGGQVLARTSVAAGDIDDNQWVPIRFSPPVPAPEVAALELSWADGPLGVWVNAPLEDPAEVELLNDPYEGGQLLVDGEPAVGDLTFRVVGAGGALNAARNVARITRQGVGRLADDPWFVLVWLALLTGAGVLAVRQLRSAAPGELGESRRDEQRGDHDKTRP